MAGFVPIRRGHKRRQPKGPQTVNWALELSRGLELALVAPDRFSPDIAHGRTVNTVTGTFWAGNTEYGEGLDFPAENTRSVSYNVPLLDKPFTLILGYKLNAIPTATRHVAGNYITNTSGFRIYASGTEFAAQFGRAGAAQVLHGSSVALGNKIDAVVADATTFSYYENGVLSDSQGQAGFVAPTKLFELGGSASPVMTIAFCYYFSRALSAAEIAELYEAPYKLLMPSTEIILIDSGLTPHDLSGDIVGPAATLGGSLTHGVPGFDVSGDIVGPSAVLTGGLIHAPIVDHAISGDLAAGAPLIDGLFSRNNVISHELTADLVVSGDPLVDGTFYHNEEPTDPVIIYTYGGDGRPITKRKRRPSANEELDLLFKDIINEFFGLNDVEELENVIDSLPITFDVDLEAMTRIEEIKYLIAAYEQYLDDEAAAQILLMD